MSKIIDKNKTVATSAAFMEAGRIANSQASKFAAKQLPMMVRGYAETALGRLLLANLASMAQEHFRSGDQRMQKLTQAMMVSAWKEVYQQIDIDGFIDQLLENKGMARAFEKLAQADEVAETK